MERSGDLRPPSPEPDQPDRPLTPFQQQLAEQLDTAIKRGRNLAAIGRDRQYFHFSWRDDTDGLNHVQFLPLPRWIQLAKQAAYDRYLLLIDQGRVDVGDSVIDDNRQGPRLIQ